VAAQNLAMRKKNKEKRQSNETKDGAIKEIEVENKREAAKTRDVDDENDHT
jgi:hypothetical protein